MAKAKEISPREFRDTYCEYGGILLRFDGEAGWKGLPACSQYVPDFGCSIHPGRPLVCRLYPLGRQKQGDRQMYIYQGTDFPCLEGCPEVVDLPQMTVSEYIEGQSASIFEKCQDAYLEVMQNIADGAFVLLLESGLAESGDSETLKLWREMGNEGPQKLADRLGPLWLDRLILPELVLLADDPEAFSNSHYEMLITEAEVLFSTLDNFDAFREASVLMMGMALHLGRSLGANPSDLAEHWINTAKEHGARE